ncbi:hypothetical protein GGR16_003242 [Chelatococcus caeni]|uniref:Uncharacterized protein n=1 Tax=Chelatococcus caeni TaxID=1348468 RepID=A0A840C3J3_9HYPH|nr:hypothetical protein [Chelatococcus caeni]MBB4018208.1 hypothetical protein [Chelatococcus caeni]
MKERLDKRRCLYGEPRLSNAQVIALRALANGSLTRSPEGFWAGGTLIGVKTIQVLERQFLFATDLSSQKAGITERGRKVLRLIEEAGR